MSLFRRFLSWLRYGEQADPPRLIVLDELADRGGATVIEFRAGDRFVRTRPIAPQAQLDESWRTPEFQERLDRLLTERSAEIARQARSGQHIPNQPGSIWD
jgi:hypothetical protein